MSAQKADEIQFSIVPVTTMPSIQRGTNQKYAKIVEAAKKLKVADTIRIPLTNSKGETNRNAIQTLTGHVKTLTQTVKVNGKAVTYQMRVSSRTEEGKVFGYIFYEEVKPEAEVKPSA